MRVFVTGASGFIGSAVVQELLNNGYQVLGLARSDQSAQAIEKMGAEVHRGDVSDTDSLVRGTENSDGVLHLGFIHDFSKFKENCEIDRKAILAMGEVLKGSNRPLIVSSGVGVLAGSGTVKVITEDERATSSVIPRVASEHAVESLVKQGVHASLIRLSPSVHGVGEHGFVPILYNIAKEKGFSTYVGNGMNRWPGVHRLDAAVLYRLAFEKAAVGGVYHGVAEEGVPFKEIASAIASQLNLPVVSKTPEEAADIFGWFAMFAGGDIPASSKKTQDLLGWKPNQIGLIADIQQSEYFGPQLALKR
jgi:nucleoside-diphosphate-sugar epimerase